MIFELPNTQPQVGTETNIALVGMCENLVAIVEASLTGEYPKEDIQEAFIELRKRIEKGKPQAF